MPTPDGEARVDGRRARRERGRVAVIDAVCELIAEDPRPPEVERVAERAGVSVSSVFRYFGSLDDLQHQTLERFVERFGPLLEIPPGHAGTTGSRIDAFVDSRLDLYAETAAILRVGRLRALEHPRLADGVARMKTMLAAQVRRHFAAELAALGSGARAADTVVLVDSLTSAESWDTLVLVHERSRRQIRRAWRHGVGALLGGTTGNY